MAILIILDWKITQAKDDIAFSEAMYLSIQTIQTGWDGNAANALVLKNNITEEMYLHFHFKRDLCLTYFNSFKYNDNFKI